MSIQRVNLTDVTKESSGKVLAQLDQQIRLSAELVRLGRILLNEQGAAIPTAETLIERIGGEWSEGERTFLEDTLRWIVSAEVYARINGVYAAYHMMTLIRTSLQQSQQGFKTNYALSDQTETELDTYLQRTIVGIECIPVLNSATQSSELVVIWGSRTISTSVAASDSSVAASDSSSASETA